MRRVLAHVLLGIATAGCTLVNAIDACDDAKPSEVQVNERGDANETLGHSQGAVEIRDHRVMVGFLAQSLETDDYGIPTTSRVRMAMLDKASATRVALCTGLSLDQDVSKDDEFAYAVSVARADLVVGSNQAAALVSWHELEAPWVNRMRFFDSAGCPMLTTFSPRTEPALSSSVIWSPVQNAVLSVMHDQRDVYAGFIGDGIDSDGEGDYVRVATGLGVLGSDPVVALAPDGRSLSVWFDSSLGPRGVLLDAAGKPMAAGAGKKSGLDLGFDELSKNSGGDVSVSVTAGSDRFTVLCDPSFQSESPGFVYARDVAFDGSLLGEIRELDPSDLGGQFGPVATYLPDDTLFAVWSSRGRKGSTAGLWQSSQRPRFNALSCDDAVFSLGARSEKPLGDQAVLMVDDELWVFHQGNVPSDSRGTAVLLWRMPFRELWPAKD